jgi:hypothetical protein
LTLYTFYCNRADGSPLSLETAELASDEGAAAWAQRVIRDHASCHTVEVFDEERLVATALRG